MDTYLIRINLDIEEKNKEKSLRFLKSAATIENLSKKTNKVIILSHMGRPEGFDSKLSLKPFKSLFEKKLKKKVIFLPEFEFKEIKENISKAKGGAVFLLENLRFLPGERKNNPGLAKTLASLGTKYVNDDFATSHRGNASNVGIAKFLKIKPSPAFTKEVAILSKIASHPKKPFVLIIGGAKASDKIDVIKKMLPQVNHILLGGGPANTFLKASGINIGKSLFEAHELDIAKELLKNPKIVIPQDSSKTDNQILDIGPKTIKIYSDIIKSAATVVWGGPMGLFEKKEFSKGTKAIWQAILRNRRAKVVVGGGETIASLKLITSNLKLKNKNFFLSTGGGAMLEFFSGKKLPALVVLKLQRR